MAKVSVLDLTGQQVEDIERAVELPVNRWAEAPSLIDLYSRVLAAANGTEPEQYKAMTLRQLVDLVSLDDAETDPTPPSKP